MRNESQNKPKYVFAKESKPKIPFITRN